MPLQTLNASDKQLVLAFYYLALPYTFYDTLFTGVVNSAISTLIFFLFSLIGLLVLVLYLFPKYLAEQKLLSLMVISLLFLTGLGLIEQHLYTLFAGMTYRQSGLLGTLASGLGSSVENVGLLSALLLGKKHYEGQLHLQGKEKQMRETELRQLKAQIDPHFLFNNLNTVDALIDSDPEKAKEYIHRLSSLYRFQITNRDEEVITVEEELEVAKNYLFLLKCRYEEAFQFKIEGETAQQFIPPGALLVLLENIVKHNYASNSQPISTVLLLSPESVKVSNNVQKKTDSVDSIGTGLRNLRARYALLSDRPIVIEYATDFSVSLPLIKNLS